MNYQETLNYLYESAPMFQQVGSKAYKEGLVNSIELDQHFGHPHQKFRTIHIAGTNGKGSCSHTIAAILQSAGYKVGLYTSPHLIDFRERIRINGQMISEQYVIDFVENHRSYFEPLHPSFFELTTSMAFNYFAQEKVDVAIIEVGMGGRLDCTNIIQPDLCVITNISFDHMQFLGNTLDKIAKEKAGIMKRDVPVIIGEANGEVKEAFIRKANETGAKIIFAESSENTTNVYHIDNLSLKKISQLRSNLSEKEILKNKALESDLRKTDLTNLDPVINQYLSKNKDAMCYVRLSDDSSHHIKDVIIGELTGNCQEKNGRTILTATENLRKIGYRISYKDILQGFANVCEMTGLMGRWQQLQSNPDLICDTGHNVAGIFYIVQQLANLKNNQKFDRLHIVFGMVNDKDISSVLEMLPKDAIYYFTKASVKRALNENDLAKQALAKGLFGTVYPSVTEAVIAAKKQSLPKDLIFVGGSSFIVADLLSNCNTLNLD